MTVVNNAITKDLKVKYLLVFLIDVFEDLMTPPGPKRETPTDSVCMFI